MTLANKSIRAVPVILVAALLTFLPSQLLAQRGSVEPAETGLSFVESDPEGNRGILYRFDRPGASLHVTGHGLRIHLGGSDRGHTLLWRVRGARVVNPTGLRETETAQVGRIGQSGYRSFATFDQLCAEAILPGIDLHLSIDDAGDPKYEFRLEPGVDPTSLTVDYLGAEEISVSGEGELAVATTVGTIREVRPVAWQEIDGRSVPVDVAFRLLDDGGVGFDVGARDPRYPLVVDPAIRFSTYLGGNRDDMGRGVAVNAAGEVYVTGRSHSFDFPITPGAWDRTRDTLGGTADVFVSKFDRTGRRLLWSTWISGLGHDDPLAGIRISSDGQLIIGGITSSDDFPRTPGVLGPDRLGGVDGFMLKLDSNGRNLIWSTLLGGSGGDTIVSFDFDIQRNLILVGHSSSGDLSFGSGAWQGNRRGDRDIFALRISSDADSIENGSWIGGTGEDVATDIVVGAGGESYLSGSTLSDDFPTTPDAIESSPLGGRDGVVVSFRFDFSDLNWSTRIGGAGSDEPEAIARNAGGGVLITGYTGSPSWPNDVGIADTGSWFVTLFRSDRTIDYSLFLSDDTLSRGLWAGFDTAGRPVLAGVTASSIFPTTANPKRVGPGGREDVALVRLAANGRSLERAAVIGGRRDDRPARHLAFDVGNSLLLTGSTNSSDFPVSRYPWDSVLNVEPLVTATDAFVLNWSIDERPNIVGPRLFPVDTLRCETTVRDTLWVHNDGERSATIYANLLRASEGPFTLIEPADISNIIVAPGDSVRYIVEYRNLGVGTFSNEILVYSTDSLGGRNPLSVPIVGVRSAPSIIGLPASLSFGNVATCEDDTLELTLRNDGRGGVTVRTPTFLNGTGVFRVLGPTTFPLSIPQGESRVVRVVFDPTANVAYSEVARFAINECPFSLLDVPLRGRGERARSEGIPDSIDFGALPPCVLAADTSFTIRNRGTVNLVVEMTGGTPADFDLDASLFPMTVEPDDSVVVSVGFRPTGPGTKSDSIGLRIGPCDSLVTIYLRGEQNDARLPFAGRSEITFGPVVSCAGDPVSVDSILRIVNPGDDVVLLSTPAVSGPFALCGLTTPTSIDPGGTGLFHICYNPTDDGSHVGEFSVEFRSGECRDTIRVSLRGSLVEPRLTPLETDIDLGLLDACETTTEVDIPFENGSSVPVTIDAIASHDDLDLTGVSFPITFDPGESRSITLGIDLGQSGPFAIPVVISTGPCDEELTVIVRGETSGVVVDIDRDSVLLGPVLACAPPNVLVDTVRVSWTGTEGEVVAVTSARLITGGGELEIQDADDLPGTEVPAGGNLPVGLRFSASEIGETVDTLELVLAPCGDTILVPIHASAVFPTLSVSSGSFGQVQVGNSLTRSIAVGNTSGVPLEIDIVRLAEEPWRVDTNGLNLPILLPPDSVVFVPVTFSPTLRGLYTDTMALTLSGGCEFRRTVRFDGEGVNPVTEAELCIRGLYLEPGVSGDTVEISIGADPETTLPAPVDLDLVIRFDPLRIDPADVIGGELSDVDLVTGRAVISAFGVQRLPEDLPKIRLRLLAGDALFTLVGLDSVEVIGGTTLAAELCDTSAIVTITNRCFVSGVTLGRFAGRIEPVTPNPAGNRIRLTFQQLEDVPTLITIHDGTGREVLRPIDGPMRGGRYTVDVDMTGLPAGLYVVAMTSGSFRGSTYFVRQE